MNDNKKEYLIEVCFSPAMFPFYKCDNSIVVIVDILRATTAMCTAFENGVKNIIPVADLRDAEFYKQKGFIIAGERDGKILEEADLGNSPFNFMGEFFKGKTIVVSTTNGTQAIEMAKTADNIVIGSFLNINALSEWILKQNKNVVILCAGWKNKFNLEDSLFAGALSELLILTDSFSVKCDSAMAAIDLWNIAKSDLLGYIEKASHRHRLKKLGLDDILEYCFTLNQNKVIPVLEGNSLINVYQNI